ncbi:MAG: hypothetical protein AB1371_01670 [Pseudomonadota bacterium]
MRPRLLGCDFTSAPSRRKPIVHALGWPTDWRACLAHYAALDRTQIRDTFAAYCAARPAGAKFAHRATDGPAGASPSMKWVNPPVAFMLHAGVPRLLDAGVVLPGLYQPPGGGDRVALEAYPGLLQAAWGLQQHEAGHPLWGLPAFDPLEGWIVTAGEPAAAVTPGGGARRTPGSRGGGPVPPR